MLRALTTAATGMMAQQNNLDVVANNIANVNTTGYKKSRAEFQDLLSTAVKTPGAMINQGTYQPVGIEIGLGVKTSATTRVFTGGTIQSTGNPYDIAIEGQGFFQIMQTDGSTAYTRDGSFKVDSMGQLCTTDGKLIQPQITIPQNASEVTVSSDGNVSVKVGTDPNPNVVGQIQLVKFQNPAGLLSVGNNLYVETPGSGTPIQGTPGEDGYGSLQQNYLEGSNVQLVDELINLIKAERAFEANSKIITASSDILRQTNQIV
ncbi:MAG: flagellar basal-body rod protein FlgG [Candidatus Gastranaerophilales bacterium]|nr:flagellar basal-body rod protein FlgG [Candidatus Gastranaerophilales bacterium]